MQVTTHWIAIFYLSDGLSDGKAIGREWQGTGNVMWLLTLLKSAK